MPSAYFRGDTHFRISVKREDKTDFYVIPSRDRILTDELHVLTVFSRIKDAFLEKDGYEVSIEMLDGSPKYTSVNISAIGHREGTRQVNHVKELFKSSEDNFKKIKQTIEERIDKIKEAFEIRKKIQNYQTEFFNRPSPGTEEYTTAYKEMRVWCDARESELGMIEPYVSLLKYYKSYRSNIFTALETVKSMALYNHNDAREAIQLFSVYLNLKDLLVHYGIELSLLVEDSFYSVHYFENRSLLFSPTDDIRLFNQRKQDVLNTINSTRP